MHKWRDFLRIHILGFTVLSFLALGTLALVTGVIVPQEQSSAAIVSSPFTYYFSVAGTLKEASSMSNTTSPYWWVNSGGALVLASSVGKTMQGDAPLSDYWRNIYAITNPLDTDNGLHPQNIFRLVSRSKWEQVRTQADFYIVKDNFSSSPNRNASNGLLLMNRYQDGNTLYYAGVRVDGTAVIKKKYKGTYYTMAQEKILPGTYGESNKNLLPHKEWIGLRSDTITNESGTVTVTLSMKRAGGTWEQLLKATDTGKNFGGTPPITESGYTGIRTDFMDVQFDNYRLETL